MLINALVESVTVLSRKISGLEAVEVVPPNDQGHGHAISQLIRQVIAARHLRDNFFGSNLFADPAWDILLDLFWAELSQRRVSVTSLCVAARVPSTTGLRWISMMVRKGMLVRHPDPLDSRRSFVELHKDTSTALHSYFAELRARGATELAGMGA